MKLKNLLPLLGFHGKAHRYGYSVKSFDLGEFGKVQYAQWNHPGETEKTLSEEEVRQYRAFIEEGDFCVDIGAHTGDSTLPIALAVGRSGMVLALEPNAYVFPVLEKNVRLNRGSMSIIPVFAAAVEKEGEMVFEYSDSGYCNGGRHEGISPLKHGHAFKLSVHGINLSNELRGDFSDVLPRLKFIKVDAEGYDLYVLRSIDDIIEEFHPYIKAEIYKYSSQDYRSELLTFFHDHDYTAYKVEKEPCTPGEKIDETNVHRWKHFDIFCVPKNSPVPGR